MSARALTRGLAALRSINLILAVLAPLAPFAHVLELRWESGHALSAALSVVALMAVARAWMIERDRAIAGAGGPDLRC